MDKSTFPQTFATADDFYNFCHKTFPQAYVEHQGGGAWVAYSGGDCTGVYDEHSGTADWNQE